MSQDRNTLTLGSADLYINGAWVGQVSDLQMERTVEIKTHETNTKVEFKIDHVIPMSTSMSLSGRFGEVSPQVLNLMLSGGMGYTSPQAVYNVPGRGGYSPSNLAAFTNTEYPFFADSLNDEPLWVPLMYTPAPADFSAEPPPANLCVDNTTGGSGTPTGYFAFVVTSQTLVGNYESIPSNISFAPYWALTDSVTLTWENTSAFSLPGPVYTVDWTVYRAPCTVGADGQPYISGPWRAYQPGTSTGGSTQVATPTLTADLQTATWDGQTYASTVTVTPVDDTTAPYTEGTDYVVDYFSRKIQRVDGGSISAFTRVFVSYSVMKTNIAELPLTALGRIPEMEIDFIHTFPNASNRFHVKLWRALLNTAARLQFSERDWMGVPFTLSVLNAEETKPTYQFGYVRFLGDISSRITAKGNIHNYDFGVVGRDRPDYVSDAG